MMDRAATRVTASSTRNKSKRSLPATPTTRSLRHSSSKSVPCDNIFRAMAVDENGLRSSPSLAHLTIFEMAIRILNTHEDKNENQDGADAIFAFQIQNYAVTFWMQHFLDIDPESTSELEMQAVVDSLHTVMDPQGEALKKIELYARGGKKPVTFSERLHILSVNSSLSRSKYGSSVVANAPRGLSPQR